MLAHQLAAAHDAAMQLLKRALDPKHPPVEMARLANCSARLMDAFQQGLLALHRVRSGGKQVIRVERLVVSNGAQAVVGNFERGPAQGPARRHDDKEQTDGRP
jgi:hypothetical protein